MRGEEEEEKEEEEEVKEEPEWQTEEEEQQSWVERDLRLKFSRWVEERSRSRSRSRRNKIRRLGRSWLGPSIDFPLPL